MLEMIVDAKQNLTGEFIYNQQGSGKGAVSMGPDAARGALLYRQVFEAAPACFAVSDLQGRVERANAAFCELVQAPAEQIARQLLQGYVLPADHAIFQDLVTQASNEIGHTPESPIKLKQASRDAIYCFASVTCFADARGEDSHLKLLWIFREATSSADVEMARLAAEVRELKVELMQARRAERERLAQFLHDDLQQILMAARIRVDVLRNSGRGAGLADELQAVGAMMQEAINGTRLLCAQLSPPILRQYGLGEGLRWLAEVFKRRFDLRVHVECRVECEPPLEVSDLLFQLVRELLFNVLKHAGVSEASLRYQAAAEGRCQITVVDSGRGFDPTAVSTRADSFGLGSVERRLRLIGGQLRLDSAPGRGTRVDVEVPSMTSSRERR